MEVRRAPHQTWALLALAGLILVLLGLKAMQTGWFEPRPPLEINGEPALVFFTLSRGCQCQMMVVHNAERQLGSWEVPKRLGLDLIRIDFNRRPDLVTQLGVMRAPALVVLDGEGQVAWKQDESLSDELPLNLDQAQSQVEALLPWEAR
jgi:hypothetical protein